MTAAPHSVPAPVRLSRLLAVGSLLGRIALGLAWELWLAPLRPGGSWLALEVLPLSSLLNGKTEKEIAAIQGQSPHTTHEYVSAIYRKFGVKNRASLMALWLGKAA